MNRSILILLISLVAAAFSYGQRLPSEKVRQFFHGATEIRTDGRSNPEEIKPQSTVAKDPSGVFGVIEMFRKLRDQKAPAQNAGGDTLVIGVTPNDSMTITGTFTHNGPILVIGNGILRFKKANATIVGDLWVWGDHAVVTADSSYLYFPQEYFYQRSLVIAGKGKVTYHNTTLDHSGLSHNLVVTDSGHIELDHVTNIGFTTCGMYKASEIDISHINQAGEFVILDSSKLSFNHAKTILLWFQVPGAGIFHYSFPKGDSVRSFTLNASTPGISGIDYSVRVDTSTDIMWGLMPSTGSDVSISDSKVRSIGLWFKGHDTLTVSGLVDNSVYTDFTANLSDRSLHIANSSVQTWSLYPMDTVRVNVSGCILGEIGSEYRCTVNVTDAYVDGSGGYWWSTDNTFMVSDHCVAENAIRSTGNSIFIFAYSTLSQGEASAMGNSILMVVQSSLPDQPVLYDGSCIWYSYLGKPSSAFADTTVPVYGSAWIDKPPSSTLMDFGWYRIFFQKSGDTVWHPSGGKVFTEKRDEILSEWNTHGLEPGLYYLKLVLADNTADSIQPEAVKSINLLPGIFGVNEKTRGGFDLHVFPDPVIESSVIRFFLSRMENLEMSVVDVYGRIVFRTERQFGAGDHDFPVGSLDLPKGLYSCILKSRDESEVVKFIRK
ncbi:MAG: hypothetical protein NTW10_03595 [Bacteroidetes bacterium]|nr:hypothetical protein [Bacteroidota bacterium]